MDNALLIAIAGSLVSMMAPGPNLVAVASTALAKGRSDAIAVAAGVSVGTMVWVAFAAFGFGALIAAQPFLLSVMKVLGGAYLLWIAVRIVRSMLAKESAVLNKPAQGKTLWRCFVFGLSVVLTNPKALLLWASISTFLFAEGFSQYHVAAFGPIALLLSFMNYGVYAVLFSSKTAKVSLGRSTSVLDGLGAACFGWFGGKLLVEGLREFRS